MLDKLIIKEPESRARAFGRVLDEVTPEAFRAARRAAMGGEPAQFFEVLTFYERLDDEIPSALEALSSAIVQDAVQIVPNEDSDEATRQVEVATEIFMQQLDTPGLIDELVQAHYYPARAVQPVWDAYGLGGATYQAPVTWELLPDWWIYAKKTGGSAHTVVHVGSKPYHEYEDGAVLLMVMRKLPSFQDIDFSHFGRGLAACRYGVYSWYNVEDWAAYGEIVGIPSVLGVLLNGYGKKDEELLKQAVFGFSSDARAVITEKTKLEFPGMGSGTPIFKEFAQELSRIKARILKGESLTDNMGSSGSFAAMRTTNGIKVDVARKLGRKVETLLNRKLLGPFLDLNFPRRLCRLRLLVKAAPDRQAELRTDEFLLKSGVELSLADLRQRYGRPAPRDDDDVVTSTRAANPFGGI